MCEIAVAGTQNGDRHTLQWGLVNTKRRRSIATCIRMRAQPAYLRLATLNTTILQNFAKFPKKSHTKVRNISRRLFLIDFFCKRDFAIMSLPSLGDDYGPYLGRSWQHIQWQHTYTSKL